MQHADFDILEVIGVGGYGTVYTAKHNNKYSCVTTETVVLKRFERSNTNEMIEVFISEVSNRLYH